MFIPLDTKTVYSFMDSLVDLKTYIKTAKELGYRHVGIMDKDNLYAAYHFIQEAKAAGLIPIIGIEITVEWQGSWVQLYLIALNTCGYHHLLKLSTAKLMGTMDWGSLSQQLDGVLVILPAEEAEKGIRLEGDYMIGVRNTSPQVSYDRPLIPLHTVRYFSNDDREALQVLQAIRENVLLREIDPIPSHQLLFPPDVMIKLFSERFPQALTTMAEVFSQVSYDFNTALKLPRFNRNKAAVEELRERAQEGLVAKGLANPAYQERLDKELGIIHQMGFDDYFLVVWDLLRFGRSQGYYMGMGRGSAAGSLVAFVLGITGIDPVKNDLLFERFLNVERYSMPDIDIDLPDIYRGEFLRYVRDRYGSDHVAQIVTFSTFGAKQAIRDVFKRFGAAEYKISQLTKKISFRDTLETVYANNLSFRQLITSKLDYQKAFAIAQKIEGQPRQTSIHAAGLVMSDEALTAHIPLKPGEEMMITQYDASAVEANGLLKMDFLGLRNLTFVQKMKEKVAEEYGVDIAIEAIDLEDSKTLNLFAAGQTKGIFQFEQAGAIQLLKRIKPERFEEVVATTSLNRPGASDYIDNFVKRKFGQEAVDLIDPLVAPILESTYGIMLYQEQVMQIAQVYAGFSLGKADLLRRAMSKKDAAEMQKMEEAFMTGARALGRSEATASDLFRRMAKFAGYGFNRSHAYAYAALAFQLAYFKAHYPAVFYDILLNNSSSDYLSDALAADFKLAKPSINTMPYHDKIVNGQISLGLKTVKGLPRDLAFWIIENRPFESIEDFLTRLPANHQKPETLSPLIQIGLFDHFEPNRRQILFNLEHLLIFVKELGSLFSEAAYSWMPVDDYEDAEKYQLEQDILGVGISPHPLVRWQQDLQGQFTPFSELVNHMTVTVLGQISGLRLIRTKTRGEQMAFISFTDIQQKLDVTVFPEAFKQWQDQLKDGTICLIKGKVQERDGRLQLIFESLVEPSHEKCWLQLADHRHDRQISAILEQYQGPLPVVLHYMDSKETLQSGRYRVEKTEALKEALAPYVMKTIFR